MWMNGPSNDVGRQLERAIQRTTPRSQRQPSGAAYMWRWFSGAPLDGAPRTDAGWFRRGAKDVTPEHRRALGWDYMPRAKRAAIRGGGTLGSGAAGVGYYLSPEATIAVLVVLGVVWGVWLTWRLKTAWAAYKLRKTVVVPMARTLSMATQETPGEILRGLVVPPDYQTDEETRIVVPLPDTWRPHMVTEVSRIVHERLGGEWTHKKNGEAPFFLTFQHKPAPPAYVSFEEVKELIIRNGSASRILQGIGTNGDPVWLDFDGDIAHLATNIGTGGGKTSFIQFLVAQFAYHGVQDFDVIDVKMDDYEGEFDGNVIPGMKIYQSLQDQWDAIEAAYVEMERRYREKNEKKRQGIKVTFPRKLMLLEEQNVFAMRSTEAWREIKERNDPPKPRVLGKYIPELLFMARAVNINLISMFQRLTADAAGGTELRDQYGMKTLSRFSHQAWDSLVGTRPRPPMTDLIGRWITVMHGVQKWVQVPYGTTEELVEFVASRPVRRQSAPVQRTPQRPSITLSRPLPPMASPEGDTGTPNEVSDAQGDTGEGEGTPRALEAASDHLSASVALGIAEEKAKPEPRYSLKEAAEAGVLPVPYERAKKHRQHRDDFPKGVKDGRSEKFTEAQLREYYAEAKDRP